MAKFVATIMTDVKYLPHLKLLLGIEGNDKDQLLSFLISDCIDRVLGYCRIESIPERLESLIPIMTARSYRISGYGCEQEEPTVIKLVQGDRAVWYDSGDIRRDDWLNDFKSRLDVFKNRKGRVPSEVRIKATAAAADVTANTDSEAFAKAAAGTERRL